MRKKIIIVVAIAVLLVLARMLANYIGKMSSKNNTGMGVPSVTVGVVDSQNVTRTFEANARIVAKYRVDVLARISGYLTRSYFNEGDTVKAGQVLFEIEPQEYLYAERKAKANLDNIKSQSDYYKKQLSRYKELVQQDYVAKSDYDNVLAQSNAYNAQEESAMSAYKDAQRNLSYTKVKAPVNGRVGFIDVTVGNFVSMNSGPLTTINSSDPMYITFAINSKDYAELVRIDNGATDGRKVDFVFSSGKKYPLSGIQDFYDNKIDETTGTITLRATFPNPNNELIQGDFGRVTIYSKLKDDMPTVPLTATMDNQEGRFVYVLDENNIPKLVYIKTMGQTEDDRWLVSEGLKIGDRIITTGLQKVIPGQPVRIVEKTVESNKNVNRKEGIISKALKKLFRYFKNLGKKEI